MGQPLDNIVGLFLTSTVPIILERFQALHLDPYYDQLIYLEAVFVLVQWRGPSSHSNIVEG